MVFVIKFVLTLAVVAIAIQIVDAADCPTCGGEIKLPLKTFDERPKVDSRIKYYYLPPEDICYCPYKFDVTVHFTTQIQSRKGQVEARTIKKKMTYNWMTDNYRTIQTYLTAFCDIQLGSRQGGTVAPNIVIETIGGMRATTEVTDAIIGFLNRYQPATIHAECIPTVAAPTVTLRDEALAVEKTVNHCPLSGAETPAEIVYKSIAFGGDYRREYIYLPNKPVKCIDAENHSHELNWEEPVGKWAKKCVNIILPVESALWEKPRITVHIQDMHTGTERIVQNFTSLDSDTPATILQKWSAFCGYNNQEVVAASNKPFTYPDNSDRQHRLRWNDLIVESALKTIFIPVKFTAESWAPRTLLIVKDIRTNTDNLFDDFPLSFSSTPISIAKKWANFNNYLNWEVSCANLEPAWCFVENKWKQLEWNQPIGKLAERCTQMIIPVAIHQIRAPTVTSVIEEDLENIDQFDMVMFSKDTIGDVLFSASQRQYTDNKSEIEYRVEFTKAESCDSSYEHCTPIPNNASAKPFIDGVQLLRIFGNAVEFRFNILFIGDAPSTSIQYKSEWSTYREMAEHALGDRQDLEPIHNVIVGEEKFSLEAPPNRKALLYAGIVTINVDKRTRPPTPKRKTSKRTFSTSSSTNRRSLTGSGSGHGNVVPPPTPQPGRKLSKTSRAASPGSSQAPPAPTRKNSGTKKRSPSTSPSLYD